jgi:hypothetical protein
MLLEVPERGVYVILTDIGHLLPVSIYEDLLGSSDPLGLLPLFACTEILVAVVFQLRLQSRWFHFSSLKFVFAKTPKCIRAAAS